MQTQQSLTSTPFETAQQNDGSAGNTSQTSTADADNISGSWIEDDAGEKSTFVFSQSGTAVGVTVQAMGQNMASGSGEINGRNVVLNLPLFGIATVVRLELSADGRELTGTYTMQTTGVPQNIRLVRMQD